MKKLIDANVILRYLLCDNQQMSDDAKNAIQEGAYTLQEVIAEVVYVLLKVYKIKRDEIQGSLTDLIEEVEIENQAITVQALNFFADTSLDYVDCILLARNHINKEQVMTFDKKLRKMLLN